MTPAGRPRRSFLLRCPGVMGFTFYHPSGLMTPAEGILATGVFVFPRQVRGKMNTWLIAALWMGLALAAALGSAKLDISVALVEMETKIEARVETGNSAPGSGGPGPRPEGVYPQARPPLPAGTLRPRSGCRAPGNGVPHRMGERDPRGQVGIGRDTGEGIGRACRRRRTSFH